jgi:hypothetical protein
MSTPIGSSFAAGLLALLLACGCGGSAGNREASSGAGGGTAISDVQRYLPLKHDTVYAFETSSENTGEKGVLMMSVERPAAGLAVLSVGGKAQRLEIVKAGIRIAAGGWLLKAPLAPAATFHGQFGPVVVRSIDKQVSVPAGNFSGCVETIEESRAVQKRVTTVFCPDVGIVLLDAEGTIGDDYGHERAELRSYGPRVDVNDMK